MHGQTSGNVLLLTKARNVFRIRHVAQVNAQTETILVVDDEKSVRELLERFLKLTGYNVVTAASGREALNRLLLGEAKIILLDLRMPDMSGMDVLRKLSEEWPKYCTIVITADFDIQTAIEAMKLGAYDYIVKPFDVQDVKEKIHKAVGRWQNQMRERQRYLQLSEKITKQTDRMQAQFEELVTSLAREHKLLIQLAAKQGPGGSNLLARLPKELREPLPSVDAFREALIRILRRS